MPPHLREKNKVEGGGDLNVQYIPLPLYYVQENGLEERSLVHKGAKQIHFPVIATYDFPVRQLFALSITFMYWVTHK